MPHREERKFVITLHLAAEFADDYEGDDDGYAWHERFERELKPRLVTAVYAALRAHPGFRVVPAPRGRSPDDALDVEVTRV